MVTKSTKKDTIPLTTEVLAIMDRAVRVSRRRSFCPTFTEIAEEVFGIEGNEIRDSDGLTCSGYDREGFDEDGFNEEGFNREGFDESGHDQEGYDREGFNRHGLNREGRDKEGRDKYRYDRNGYDKEGYDHSGERRRASRQWYADQSAKPETEFRFDLFGYERPAPKKSTRSRTKKT